MGEAVAVMSLGDNYDTTRALALRTRIARIAGVNLVEFNYTNNKVTVQYDPNQVSQEELKNLVMRDMKHRPSSSTKLKSSG